MKKSHEILSAPPASAKSATAARAEARTEQLTERLLEAATQLFMEKGYEGTSMGEISARARASKETFYRHFPTKDALFEAVVLRRAESIAVDVGLANLANDPPAKALTAFGERFLLRMMTEDQMAFHRAMTGARAKIPGVVQLYRTAGPYRVRAEIAGYLQSQIKAGTLRQMNTEVAARQFLDLATAEMIISASINGKMDVSKQAIRQRVKEAVNCFLHGYAAH